MQSVLEPRGFHAEELATLAWVLFGAGGAIFLAVAALTALALFGPAKRRAWLGTRRAIVACGAIFPIVALSALLLYSFLTARSLSAGVERPALTIEVIGEQWWWRVNYLDARGRHDFATANEIHIPAGRTVELVLKSADVLHSFWVPSLAGKMDMVPGRVNRLRVHAREPGVFRGQCAEYCGGPHAWMAFYVVADSGQEFDAWAARQREPAAQVREDVLDRGRTVFLSQCAVCHAVRGTPASGTRGPDLTHVGGRSAIAAGALTTNAGTLAAWIVSSQHIKPGNLMPSFTEFSGEDLNALAAYLDRLK